MSRIMLATNAGADSRVLHVAALRRAQAADTDLAVVHVIGGPEFEAQPQSLRDAIESETEWLLDTMMHLAAERCGISDLEVSVHVRDGDVADELVEFAASTRPSVVLVGVPRDADHSEFSDTEYNDLIGRLEHSGIEVEQVRTE